MSRRSMPASPQTTRSLAPAPSPGPAAAPHLLLDQVTKDQGERRVLERVSLALAAGELLCVLGPSGSGKSTLLRAIAGTDPATSGRILLEGRDITALPPSARGAGVMLETAAASRLPAAAALGQVLRGRLWPPARRAQRVAELLRLLDLPAQPTLGQLSGGQRQRLALARALASEPDLLLLDDPFSGQDPQLRAMLRQELRAMLRRLGSTLVMVTQDQEEALLLADRILVLAQGRVAQLGTPEEIYRRPATAFAAHFIGHGSFLPATVDAPPGMLRADALALPSLDARRLTYGTPVQAFLRPEDVVLGPAAAALEGHFAARVLQQEFRGPALRLTLQAGALRLLADVNPDAAPALGEVLLAAIPAERLLVFPTES
ncbi:ABC transporter ATP-binding protein [Falsiroseomonas sp.]|uniref:ABC transporter ATP-binding protein n=1 Tax=Falsiroseomonas sp. TaxID=2870721 RepID=UPI003F723198